MKIDPACEIFDSCRTQDVVEYYSRRRTRIFFVYSIRNQNYLWYQIASAYVYDTIEEYNKFMCNEKNIEACIFHSIP